MAGATLTEQYRSARTDPSLAVLEGLHALKHALRFGADVLDARTPALAELLALARELAPDVTGRVEGLAEPVDRDAYEALAPSPHPTDVIALARRPAVEPTDALDASGPAPVILLERATHHGNIGAVVRVAAAAGAAGVLVTGPHDPWHPASIRGGAGLQFALPVMSLEPDGVNVVLASDRPIVALDPEGEPLVTSGARTPGTGPTAPDTARGAAPGPAPPVPERAVLVFGSERTGVSDAVLAAAHRRLSIPMREGVSSLNLATAVAVALCAAGDWAAFSE